MPFQIIRNDITRVTADAGEWSAGICAQAVLLPEDLLFFPPQKVSSCAFGPRPRYTSRICA